MIRKLFRARCGSALWLPSLLLVTAACSDSADPDGQQPADAYYRGELSAALGSANNGADCALCHSVDGTLEGYSGESFEDIAYRSEFKGGSAADLIAATNACVTGWMGGDALTENDPAWLALKSFMQSISDASVTEPNTLMPEVLADEAAYETTYAGGDSGAGEAKYATFCAACHDEGLIVGSAAAWPKSSVAALTIGRIAQKVRTAGPPPSGSAEGTDSTPGPMPFFEVEELSQADLRDIIAYLKG